MRVRICAAICAIGLTAPAVSSAQPASGDAEHNWAEVVQCGALAGADARHKCVDGILRRAGVLDPVRVAQERRQEFGRSRRAEEPRRPAAPRAEVAESSQDEILTTIKAVRTVGYKQIRVVTAEGSVWQQTQTTTLTTEPKVGDPFSVVRASLDSFRCRFANSMRYRCERVD